MDETLALNLIARDRTLPAFRSAAGHAERLERQYRQLGGVTVRESARGTQAAGRFGIALGRLGAEASRAGRQVASGLGSSLRQTAAAFERTADRAAAFNNRVTRLQGQFGSLTQAAGTLLLPFRGLAAVVTLGINVLGRLTGAFSALLGNIGQVAMALGGTLLNAAQEVFTLLSGVGVAAVGAVSTAMALFAKRGIDTNLLLRKTEATMTTLFRSSEKAAAFMGALGKEAATSAFELVDLAKHAESLAAFGFRDFEILPMLRTLGDVARGDEEKLQRLAMAFGQIRAKGVMQGEEALQLTEAGLPVREMLKLPVGVDFGDAKLSADKAIPQLLKAMQERFGGLQAGAVETLPGRISNIQDALNNLSATATTGLLAGLTEGAGKLLDFLNGIEESVAGRQLLKVITDGFTAVGRAAGALAAQLPNLLTQSMAFIQGLPWQEWGSIALNAFDLVREGAGQVGGWLTQHWPTIWGAVTNTAVEAAGILGGVFAGVQRVIERWSTSGSQQTANFFNGLREFTADAIIGLGRLTAAVAHLTGAWAMFQAINPINIATGQSENFYRISKQALQVGNSAIPAADTMASVVRNLNPDIGLNQLRQQPGVVGDFFSGFQEFRNDFKARGAADLMKQLAMPRNLPNPFGGTPADTRAALNPILGKDFEQRQAQAAQAALQSRALPLAPQLAAFGYSYTEDGRRQQGSGGALRWAFPERNVMPGAGGTLAPGVPELTTPAMPAIPQPFMPYQPGPVGAPGVTVNAPVTVHAGAPGMAALLQMAMQDPRFRQAHEAWLKDYLTEWAYGQSQTAAPGPSY
jgi:tape measure domain-containing protein